jgi:hypothetical protein
MVDSARSDGTRKESDGSGEKIERGRAIWGDNDRRLSFIGLSR